jgi:hypothetical protein
MRCQTQRTIINVAGKLQQGWHHSLDVWFPWILGILILLYAGVKVINFGVLRILMPVFTVPSAFRKCFGSDREQYPCYPPPFMEIK